MSPTRYLSEVQELYETSEAKDAGLDFEAFREALEAVGQRFLSVNAAGPKKIAFYRTLHLNDFALAQSCSLGNSAAWERFVELYSGRLYAAAMIITKNKSVAKELSGSLAGELFVSRGVKMASYSGRGSLEGWLKALLTHTYVDKYRSQRRTVSLEQRLDLLRTLCVSQPADRKTGDSRLNRAIEEAFLQCTPEERFLLTAYFFDGRTLASLAQLLGIHESSASRRLDRIVRELRRNVARNLQRTGMSARQIKECCSAESWEPSIDLRALLLGVIER